jgi:hypothetical protein
MVLDYLKVVLTWPVISGSLIAVFLFLFKSQISGLINRIGRIKFPGGEVSMSQQEKIELASPGPVAPPVSQALPQGLHLSPEQIKQIESYLASERAATRVWEYRFLNYFFAQATQNVLDWFVSLQQSTTVSAFEAIWMHAIQNAQERTAILHALQMHVLINISGETITLTDKGREYASWPGRRRLAIA